MLNVDPEDLHSPVARGLITHLVRELADRYPEDQGEEEASFNPADATGLRSVVVVAWFGSEPVGCGALRPLPGTADTAEIKRMFVLPASRGKGFGREILQDLEKHARTFGYARLVLETGIRQPEAIALYEKSGFTRIPNFAPYEDSVRSLCFEKIISPH